VHAVKTWNAKLSADKEEETRKGEAEEGRTEGIHTPDITPYKE